MSKPDLSDPDVIARLTAALEAAGVSGIEVTRPKQSLLIRLSGTGTGEVLKANSGKPSGSSVAVIVKAPMAGEFWPSDMSRVQTSGGSEISDVVGFLKVGPILLPVAMGPSQRLRKHLAVPGAMVGFGDPIAEVEPQA